MGDNAPMQPEVEFFSDDVDGQEYLNVGLKWEDSTGQEVRAVLGAFTGTLEQEALRIIKGLVEQAGMYLLELDREPVIDVPSKEVTSKLIIAGQ